MVVGKAGVPWLPQWKRPFQPFYGYRINMFLPNNSQGAPKCHIKLRVARCVRSRSFSAGPPYGPESPWEDPEGPRLGRGCCAHRAAAFVCSGRPMGPCGPMGGPCHQGTCERDCYTPILVWAVTIESHADRNMLNTSAASDVSVLHLLSPLGFP